MFRLRPAAAGLRRTGESWGSGKLQVRETELDRHTACFFFRKAIGVGARERFDQCALAVVDVTSGCDNEISRFHAFQSRRWRHGRTSQSNCIYNRLIFDELEATNAKLPFDLTSRLDVSWARPAVEWEELLEEVAREARLRV